MEIRQIVALAETYGALCLVISAILCGITALVKKFCPARAKKFLTVFPFVLGIGCYLVYRLILGAELDWEAIVRDGLQAGGLSTVLYIAYEQFFRGKHPSLPAESGALVIYGILSQAGVSGDLCALADRSFEAVHGQNELTAADRLRPLLSDAVPDGEQRELLVRLIVSVATVF